MMDALKLLFLVALAIYGIYIAFGYDAAYDIGNGAFAIMAAMVSLTFLWLWSQRTTPLALGMALGWAGASSVMGWWWIFNLLREPEGMRQSSEFFLFLSVYFAGAVMHFSVIGRSLRLAPALWGLPVLLAVAASTALHIIFFGR